MHARRGAGGRRGRWALALLGLVAAALTGCPSVLEPVPLPAALAATLLRALEAPVGSGSSAAVGSDEVAGLGSLVVLVRPSVVEVQARQTPRVLGWLKGLGATCVNAVVQLPSLWPAIAPPFYALFGWIGEFFVVGRGTGFVVARDGDDVVVLTNAHVVGEHPARLLVRTFEGAGGQDTFLTGTWDAPAELVWSDEELDAALLRVRVPDRRVVPLPLGTAGPDLLGRPALAVGYPSRGEALDQRPRYPTTTLGHVTSLDVAERGRPDGAGEPLGLVQTDAALNPGNSGGPLLDVRGRVIGISSAKVEGADNIGFAIPIDWVRRVATLALRGPVPGGAGPPTKSAGSR